MDLNKSVSDEVLLEKYPKEHPPLPPEYEDLYNKHYKDNREGNSAASGLAQKMERWMHKQVAKDLPLLGKSVSTLEIGAGTLNHLVYEKNDGVYDIVEPFKELFEGSDDLSRIGNIYDSIHQVNGAEKYDRIITIATFEHVCDLPQVIAKSALLLKDGGSLRVAIPSEGSLLWYLGWRLTTGIEFYLKNKLDYGVMMRHEHVNNYFEVQQLLKMFFREVNSSQLGPMKSLSFYQFYECKNPKLDKAIEITGDKAESASIHSQAA